MDAFEYKIIISDATSLRDEERMLNEMGKEGWELVSIKQFMNSWFYFKRPKS